MPALYLFGRSWAVGTDDLFFPAVVSLLWRIGWMIGTAFVLTQHLDAAHNETIQNATNETTYETNLTVFLSVHVAIHFLCALIELLIVANSLRGSIFDTHKRLWVPRLILARIILLFVEIPWMAVGFAWAIAANANSIRTLLIFGWVTIGAFVVKILCTFDPCGIIHAPTRASERKLTDSDRHERAHRTWSRRCRFFCCCADIDDKATRGRIIGDVSRLFADYFHDIDDMIASDVSAGLTLVQLRQEAEERAYNEKSDITSGALPYKGANDSEGICAPFDFDDYVQVTAYKNAAYFMKYALAAYGWMFFVYDHVFTGLCRLIPGCRCCACCLGEIVGGDNCCECDTAAVRRTLNLDEEDLIYVSFENETFKPAFYVAVDHEKSAVIVACRGTLSMSDALTDITAFKEPVPMKTDSAAGNEIEFHAHKGILEAAQHVMKTLTEKDLLAKAFQRAKRVQPTSTTYNLVVLGHSLGAGTASLLAILLRSRHPEWNVVCFAYSPPGALVSDNVVEYTKKFTTSVVLGKDVVSHLNFPNMYKLRDMMRDEAKKTRAPKCSILLTCCCICCCRCCPRTDCVDIDDVEAGDTDRLLPASPQSPHVHPEIPQPLLHAPGNIIYLARVPSSRRPTRERQYVAYWTDYRFLHTILLGPAMVGDHVPNKVNEALQNVLPRCGDVKLSSRRESSI
ncbi:diacylglycerol lipase-alpha-like [Oscarella lobularis]|uniref:diacylglycerol lipase-alpha-like n=1 Tax=Oscarella lobularis TaxID=121494 RepID=UPI00331345C1